MNQQTDSSAKLPVKAAFQHLRSWCFCFKDGEKRAHGLNTRPGMSTDSSLTNLLNPQKTEPLTLHDA